jgi:hypothetical protein
MYVCMYVYTIVQARRSLLKRSCRKRRRGRSQAARCTTSSERAGAEVPEAEQVEEVAGEPLGIRGAVNGGGGGHALGGGGTVLVVGRCGRTCGGM